MIKDWENLLNHKKKIDSKIKEGKLKKPYNLSGHTDYLCGVVAWYGKSKVIVVDASETTAWSPSVSIMFENGKTGSVWHDQLKY